VMNSLQDVFKLDVIQEQPEMDGEDEKCNYDYKGDIIVKRNTFGYLRTEVRVFQN
jgi:hypothetical protein